MIDPVLLRRLGVLLLLAVCCGADAVGVEQSEGESPASIASGLQDEDVANRRAAALASRSLSAQRQREILPALIDRMMNEKDGQVRLAVLDTLFDMGEAAEEAVPALIHSLKTDYGGKRNEETHQDYRSALALAAIGSASVDGLRGLLSHEKENVRCEAAMALGRIGPDASAATADLIERFGDEKTRIRRESTIALGLIGTAARGPLLEASRSENALLREAAIGALGRIAKTDDGDTAVLLDAANDIDPSVRAAAIKSLSKAPLSDNLMEALRENLASDQEIARVAVVNLLAARPKLLRKIEPDLKGLLLHDDDGVAWHAAFLLQSIGLDAAPTLLNALENEASRIDQIAEALALLGRPAADLMVQSLDDPNPRVRQGAALALAQMRPGTDTAAERLAGRLNDQDREVQAAVLRSIGFLGSRAGPALAGVRAKLSDESPEIRAQAIGILFAAAPRDERLVDQLIVMLEDPDPAVQKRAIDAIRAAGPPGRRAMDQIVLKLDSGDEGVRSAAAEMIGSHGRSAVAAVPKLAALLDHEDPSLRAMATETLSKLGVAARPALDKLIPRLEDSEAGIRVSAVQTVANFDLDPPVLRSLLADTFHDSDAEVSRQALRAIRRLGRQGTIFVPDLISLVADEERSGYVDRILKQYEDYGTHPDSIGELIELLDHQHDGVRRMTIKFLGIAGPEANAALSRLDSMLGEADDETREALEVAIGKISSPGDDTTESSERSP